MSLSSEVLPVFREYERSMTTALNAQIMPVVSSYVARLEGRLASSGVVAPLLLMKSSGGVAADPNVVTNPIGPYSRTGLLRFARKDGHRGQ